ncbi:MAG: hypothetical protein L3J31_09240 [Bacteroidales bacterium]|nr:hypothetical protein [Bacteroidales bacterium]
MKKEKIILQLGVEIDSMKAHIQRLKRVNYEPHPLDVELLQQKTRHLYDLLFELENLAGATSSAMDAVTGAAQPPVEKTTVPEKEKLSGKPETRPAAAAPVKTERPASQSEIPLPMPEAESPGALAADDGEDSGGAEKTPPRPSPEGRETGAPEIVEETPEVLPSADGEYLGGVKKETPKPKPAETRSNFDLFSDNTTATVGDKFAGREESLADKMQHSRVSDLRQSIGINEKFLFINELFNGDLGRYNKTVDELNALTTLKGVQTFLMEIKIQHQWDEGLEAYQKLSELAERKFK